MEGRALSHAIGVIAKEPACRGGVLPDAIPADHLSRFFGSRFHSVGKGGYGALFAVFALRSLGEGGPGTSFIEHYACRGTNYLGARKLSRCRI